MPSPLRQKPLFSELLQRIGKCSGGQRTNARASEINHRGVMRVKIDRLTLISFPFSTLRVPFSSQRKSNNNNNFRVVKSIKNGHSEEG